MTDEEFVRKWLRRKWGMDFAVRHPDEAKEVGRQIKKGTLDTAFSEGYGTCT